MCKVRNEVPFDCKVSPFFANHQVFYEKSYGEVDLRNFYIHNSALIIVPARAIISTAAVASSGAAGVRASTLTGW